MCLGFLSSHCCSIVKYAIDDVTSALVSLMRRMAGNPRVCRRNQKKTKIVEYQEENWWPVKKLGENSRFLIIAKSARIWGNKKSPRRINKGEIIINYARALIFGTLHMRNNLGQTSHERLELNSMLKRHSRGMWCNYKVDIYDNFLARLNIHLFIMHF